MMPEVHVAAGVVADGAGRILVALRAPHLHQGGLWEFPGGKLERGETPRQALARELLEELGVVVEAARPLIRVAHDYPDKRVLLDVWRVTRWHGDVRGRQGQSILWMPVRELRTLAFPAANLPILAALVLPDTLLVTPDAGPDDAAFLARLEELLGAGIALVQFRVRDREGAAWEHLARAAVHACERHGARLLVNAAPEAVTACGAHGVHLSGARLAATVRRPLPAGRLVSAACHDAAELAQAARIEADFVVLGPVQPTASHPHATPLGWERFAALAPTAGRPVYALGGLTPADLDTAWNAGAQGIAAIRGLWEAG